MLRDPSTENSVDKEYVVAAISSIKSKGWDVNPFTVADEMKVPRSAIYQNIEFMTLIIEARGGSFGMDMDSSLDVARRIQELEAYINQLQSELEQMHQQLHPTEVQDQTSYDSGVHYPQIPNPTVVTGDQQIIAAQTIFNAASTAPIGASQQSISELSWKELEAVYNFTAASLMDLSRRMSGEDDIDEPPQIAQALLQAKIAESAEAAPASEAAQDAQPHQTRAKRKRKTSHDESPEIQPPEEVPAPHKEEIAAQPEPAFQPEIAAQPEPILQPETTIQQAPEAITGKETTTGDMPIAHATVESAAAASSAQHPIHAEIQADVAAASIESIPDDILDSLSPDEFAFEGEAKPPNKNEETSEHPVFVPPADHPPDVHVNPTPDFIPEEIAPSGFAEPPFQPQVHTEEKAVEAYEEEEEEPPLYHPAANEGSAARAMRMLNASPYDSLTNIPAMEMPPSLSLPPEMLEALEEKIPDLETMDIFEDFSGPEDLEQIEMIEGGGIQIEGEEENPESDDAISGDELRELIKNRIKQASDHLGPDTIPPSEKTEEGQEEPKAGFRSKFVGTKAQATSPSFTSARVVPPEIRKACLILGVRPEDIAVAVVLDAWKKQIAAPGVHPDLGGDTESAIYLNTAKDTLVRWIESQEPKLSKKFGAANKEKVKPDPKDKDKEKAT
jgi:hypothetical protein